MNRIIECTAPCTFTNPQLAYIIATEVESGRSLPAKAVREWPGIKFLDCKKRVASGEKISWIILQSDEPNTCAAAHRESERIREDSSPASGAVPGLGAKSRRTDC